MKSVPYGRRSSHSREGFAKKKKKKVFFFCVFYCYFQSRERCAFVRLKYAIQCYFFLYDRYITYAFKHYELISASQRQTLL